MKLRVILLVLILSAATYTLINPGVIDSSASLLREFWFQKKLSIRGLRILSVEAVREKLPKDRSNPWWLFNTSTIESKLLRNPFIRKVSVESCSGFMLLQWGCFNISIEERELHYLAPYRGSFILLGQDGSTFGTVSVDQLEDAMRLIADPDSPRPKILNGLIPEDGSNDITRVRFNYLVKVIKKIEDGIQNISISRANLHPNGEVTIKARNYSFEINFDSSEEHPERLPEEINRLKRLLIELKGREETIKSIDLAFDKLAVVTPKM